MISGWWVHTAVLICSRRWWGSLNSCINSDVVPLQKLMIGMGLSNMKSVLWFVCLFVSLVLAVLDSSFQSWESPKPEGPEGWGKISSFPLLQFDGRFLARKFLCTLENLPEVNGALLGAGISSSACHAAPLYPKAIFYARVWRNLIPDLHVAACDLKPFIF